MASLATIHPGDIVMCDVKGHRAYALVTGKANRRLTVTPISHGFTYREVSSHQVAAHWRKTKNARKVGPGHDAE